MIAYYVGVLLLICLYCVCFDWWLVSNSVDDIVCAACVGFVYVCAAFCYC